MNNTITERKIEVIPACAGRRNKSAKFHEALRLASRMLQAKIVKDARNKALCVCLQYLFDNGECPVHSKGL